MLINKLKKAHWRNRVGFLCIKGCTLESNILMDKFL